MQETIVSCVDLVKIYQAADLEVVALQGLDLDIKAGEMIAIVGASGSGKSTLLNIIGGLDTPSAGKCFVDGHNLARLTDNERASYRGTVVGHLWQQSGRNLRPELSIGANVELPQILMGEGRKARKHYSARLLEMVGLADLMKQKPIQLSGGQQQRAALAVALANRPRLLLADEPTGELDSATAREILTFLRQLNHELGLTIIIVTHDAMIAHEVDRTLAIRDGRTSTETIRRSTPLQSRLAAQMPTSAVIGLSHQTHKESILVDRVGRLQLPKEIMETLEFNGRADVELIEDHVELRPTPKIPEPTTF